MPKPRSEGPVGDVFESLDTDAFRDARRRIRPRIHHTPLLGATLLGRKAGVDLSLKCENLQKTGSFKPRGVLNRVGQLDPSERERGVVTVSAGNHAQALAWGAATVDSRAVVVMPADAPETKIEACRSYGGEVILEDSVFEAFDRARELERDRGLVFVHPFDDAAVVAGQGTVGLEIIEDDEAVEAVIVPVGGGGLLAGIAAALESLRPTVKVYGVEPEGAASMVRSLEAGRPLRLDELDTVADGLASPMAGDLTYPLVSRLVDDVVTVADDEIADAVGELLTWTKLLTEPAGAAAVAALLAGRIPDLGSGERVAAVLSGGNVDLDRLAELI